MHTCICTYIYIHISLVRPTPALLPVELHCDVPLKDGRPVVITWMVGQLQYFFLQPSLYVYTFVHLCVLAPAQYGNETEEEGVVYPGEVEVSVELDPRDMACSDVTADDISCSVSITRDEDYTVSLTLSNDVGSTPPVESMFNCEFSTSSYTHVYIHVRCVLVYTCTY